MCGKQKFLFCEKCGNLIGLISDRGGPMLCCNESMKELVPNTVEASVEKHLPVVEVGSSSCCCGDDCYYLCVKVGGVPHPMEDEHFISFIYVETERGGQRKCLKAGEEPKLDFYIKCDKAVAVYAYCNLHGLWKTEIK